MAGHGFNAKVLMNGYDLTGYFDSFGVDVSAKTAETTVFQVTNDTHVIGPKTASFSAEGFMDGSSTNTVDRTLNDAFGSTNQWSWYPNRDTVGKYGFGMVTNNTSYNVKGSITQAVRIAAGGQSNISRDRLISLHDLTSESATSTGADTSVSNTASTSGGVGYLHVTTNPCTGLAVYVEHSDDDLTYTALVTFTACTGGRNFERKEATGSVKQYVRSAWKSTDVCNFQVGFCRK